MTTFTVELITPEKLLFSGPAEQVDLPGAEGDMGVLPGHAPLIAALRAGTVTISTAGALPAHYAIEGGVAEISPTRCTLLADGAQAKVE